MASDFGDESGEKLFDWMLRMGQDAGQDAIRASAERLRNAIRNVRGQMGEEGQAQGGGAREFARLNMSEFEELPNYATLKEIIDEKLNDAAIEHDFVSVDGHDHLVFRVAAAPEVDEVFANLEKDVDKAAEQAIEQHEHDLSEQRDAEPLEQKAEAAKAASAAAHESKEATRQMERVEVKAR